MTDRTLPLPSARIGEPNRPVRALTFTGGGFDTAMQLGVIHALLVSRSRPPDIVAGVSMGAVNAVALAEVFQAGKGAEQASPERRDEKGQVRAVNRLGAQVATFRRMLEELRTSPADLAGKLIPDPYQLDARRPLEPLVIPIHDETERRERNDALRARFGLIDLANDLLGLRLSVGTLTRLVRRVLGWRAAGEQRIPVLRSLGRWNEAWGLWRLAVGNLFGLTPVVWRVATAVAGARARKRGASAGALVFRSRIVRALRRGSLALVGVLISAAVLLAALVVLVVWPVYIALTGLARALGAVLWPRREAAVRPAGSRWLDSLSRGLLRRLLRRYSIHDSLLDPYPLRSLFVRLFDPAYYGRANLDSVLDRALVDDNSASSEPRSEKLIGDYARGDPPITVAAIAADVATGELTVLPPEVRVVDALQAATAAVPLFPAVPLDGRSYVDGVNVANEPTRALVDYLRDRLEDDATTVHIYPVTSIPLSKVELGPANGEPSGLVDVAARALTLRRFRDATLERRVTELYTRSLPEGKAVHDVGGHRYVRAGVYPIEPERLLNVNARLLAAPSRDRRRNIVAETVADGCRATLERIIRPAITKAPVEPDGFVRCRAAVAAHLGGAEPLPGSDREGGPGVPEVCAHCLLTPQPGSQAALPAATSIAGKQRLRRPAADVEWPPWPRVGEAEPDGSSTYRRVFLKTEYEERTDQLLLGWAQSQRLDTKPEERWPRARGDRAGDGRPLVTLLLSGGVFRGVYQIGVLAALSEAGLDPDLIAGASVGSITAALAGALFTQPRGPGRDRLLASLAASYLAVDRLVLTDRFADFIRLLTLRCAATEFSLREVDDLFRRFDRTGTARFGREARRVIAGLERLFYVSPFELRDLVRAVRLNQVHRIQQLVRADIQEWLDRGGVGDEVLGAEPLALLITEQVLRDHVQAGSRPAEVPFNVFEQQGIYFLATATNLSAGRLEVIGEQQFQDSRKAVLLDALLASSAFPGVFRPRWAWEVMPRTERTDRYVDGGVMDNLPLDGVAQFLFQAARAGLIASRPEANALPVPHLVFTASLEVDPPHLTPQQLADTCASWPELLGRARRFSYNKKLDNFAATQRDLRRMASLTPFSKDLLDLEVVAVKPAWLSGTFAFHPMLGFRRARQAASVAHGCATTLARWGDLDRNPESSAWVSAWGITKEVRTAPTGNDGAGPLAPRNNGPNKCWFRPDVVCPFSPGRLEPLRLHERTAEELAQIYYVCGRADTHLS